MRRINSLLGAAFHGWAALGGFARIFLCILIVIAGTVISAEVFSMRLNPHAFWLETDRKAPVDYGYGPDKGIGPPRPNHVLGQTPAIPKSLIAAPTVAGAARAPEGRRRGRLFFPPSRSRLSPPEPRLYHSAALLLPEGSVLTGGGGAPGPVNELNLEIYYPAYLYLMDGSGNPAPRPTIVSAPSKLRLGQTFSVTVTGKVKSAPEKIPPGYYMLFVLNTAGVPAVAKIVVVPQAVP